MKFSIFNFQFSYFEQELRSGFTLIELLVVAAIGSILVGGGLATYQQFDERQRVASGGREILVALRDAQKRAQSGEKPAGCATLEGWSVQRQDLVSYSLVAECTNGPISSKFYELPQGIQFSTDPDVMFRVLTGAVEGSGTISLGDVDGDYQYDLEVSGAGSLGDKGIRDAEAVEPTSDPTPSLEP